jgi:hypothetical protein
MKFMAKDGWMTGNGDFAGFLRATAAQIDAYGKREESLAEKHYGNVMQESARVLAAFTRTASFDQLVMAEKTLQQNDLAIYAKAPSTMKSVQQGISDFKNGEDVYGQLLNNPQAYSDHKYRDSERVGSDKLVPLDAMRRALRGQVKRVENYRKNVMGNPKEQEFMSARIAVCRPSQNCGIFKRRGYNATSFG